MPLRDLDGTAAVGEPWTDPHAMPFLLANHVHLCQTDDGVVILDLKRHKYMGLGTSSSRSLAMFIRGWPAREDRRASTLSIENAGVERVINKMVAGGLLTRDERLGRDFAEIALDAASGTLDAHHWADAPRVRFGHVVTLVVACCRTAVALHWRSLEFAVHRLRTRKARATAASPHFDLARARYLVSVFCHVRPLLYTSKEKCLFDSLVLAEFLASYGMFPTVVFGVATAPFRAHCWVQQNGLVFNCHSEYVQIYTPILAI